MLKKLLILIIIAVVGYFGYQYLTQPAETDKETLSQETARTLVVEKWGDCTQDVCDNLNVKVLNGEAGAWLIEVIYNGLRDDSVRSQKRAIEVNYENNEWQLGDVVTQEYICQPGRGQQDFSDELCI